MPVDIEVFFAAGVFGEKQYFCSGAFRCGYDVFDFSATIVRQFRVNVKIASDFSKAIRSGQFAPLLSILLSRLTYHFQVFSRQAIDGILSMD